MKRVSTFVFLFSIFLGLACHRDDPRYFGRVMPKHPPDEVWINNSTEAETIDPAKCADENGGEIIRNTFAGLIQPHPKTLQPVPDLAETWDISADRTVYTFHLRESRWSDGRPVTAADFEWSWKRVVNPATASKYASIFDPILNAEAVRERAIRVRGLPGNIRTKADLNSRIGDENSIDRMVPDVSAKDFWIFPAGKSLVEKERSRERILSAFGGMARDAELSDLGARATDDRTLVVTLGAPVPYFLDLVSYYTFMPVPRHVIERLAKEGKDPDLWTRPEHFVSNGPYVLKKWRFRQEMSFERNPFYWDAAATKLQRVRLLMVEQANTLLNFYRSADLDWSGRNGSLPTEFMDRLTAYKDFSRDPFLSVYFFWVNTKAAPLENVKLRRALSLSIDREAIVKHVIRANMVPTADLVPDGLGGYQGLKSPIFDPESARRSLKEAGYASGDVVPPITLIYNTSAGHKQIAEAIQQMWKKELGIRVRIENQEWKVFLANQAMMNFQISRQGWVGDFPDPVTFLDLLMSNNGNNHSNWARPDYDELLRTADRTPDPASRLAMLRKAEEIVHDETPLIPVYVYTRNYLEKPYLLGHWGNYQDRHPWKYLWIDRRWYRGIPEKSLENEPPALASR